MTPTREELLAQRAEIDANPAALDAQPDWGPAVRASLAAKADLIAAREAEQKWEPANKVAEPSAYELELHGLQAALPLAPAPLPMGEDEIEALVDEALRAAKRDAVSPNNACVARHAIRETLRRVPAAPPMGEESAEEFADYLAQFFDQRVGAWRSKVVRAIIERDRRTLSRVPSWPGEGELREMARAIAREGFLGASYHVKDAALEMARRLKERMGAGGGA